MTTTEQHDLDGGLLADFAEFLTTYQGRWYLYSTSWVTVSPPLARGPR